MNRFISMVTISLLVAFHSSANSDEPAQLSDVQKEKIALIKAEIRAQIKALEELERKLIAAVSKEKPQPQPAALKKVSVPMGGAGLVGFANVAGHDSGILFHYTQGLIFNPEPLRSRIEGDFILTLRGQLQVPRDMVVEIWHAGGGVSHDVNTLFVNDKKISSVGDDRSKQAIDELKLKKGSHNVQWKLTGGTFRHNLLKFVDPDSGELVPLEFVTQDLPDVPIKEFVRVGTDERGWPIPNDWQIRQRNLGQ